MVVVLQLRINDTVVMANGPTILAKVRGLLERRAPQRLCDDCIAEELDLSWPSRANRATRELSQRDGFERCAATCAVCDCRRTVIGKVAD